MSTSTGAPLNLNKFETSDDIVTALTTLFNQNMDKLNQANTGVKTWAPSTVYNKGDLVLHKWGANQLMFASVAHTSSTASTEDAWNSGDGTKWVSLSSNLYMQDPSANEYLMSGTVVTDGGQIKRARVNTYPGKASYMQDMDLLTSRIVRWSPNTHYNVGDMFVVSSPSLTINNYTVNLNNVIFVVKTAFTSGSSFPASDNAVSANYKMVNPENYTASGTLPILPYVKPSVIRKGNHITVSVWTTTGSYVNATDGGWKNGDETFPKVFTPWSSAGAFFKAYVSREGGLYYHIEKNGKTSFWGLKDPIKTGSWLHGSGSYDGDENDLIWSAFTPVN